MVPRESEDNAYAKFWVDKQRALWYVTVFWGMVNIAPIPDYLMDTISIDGIFAQKGGRLG